MTNTSRFAIIAALIATIASPIFTATSSDAATKGQVKQNPASAQASLERPASLGPMSFTAGY